MKDYPECIELMDITEASSTMRALSCAHCLRITNKDRYQNNKLPRTLALLNSPLVSISMYTIDSIVAADGVCHDSRSDIHTLANNSRARL